MRVNREKETAAFTLLEIMLVVMIIGLLLGTAIYKMRGSLEASKSVAVETSIQTIKTQLKLYESLNGFPPSNEQGLKALVTQPQTEPRPTRWNQYFESLPKDPWGNEFFYACPGRKNPDGYDVYSAGKDRIPGTPDDEYGSGGGG